jgi:two-component system, sensor histidine kinase
MRHAGARRLQPRAAGLRVLLAEDNLDLAEPMAHLLRAAGHDVDVVHDGAAALANLRTQPPDVAILDIGIPEMDGWQVAERARTEGAMPVLLIALTAYDQPSDRERSRHAGFDHHLVKPVDVAALCQLLDAVGHDN